MATTLFNGWFPHHYIYFGRCVHRTISNICIYEYIPFKIFLHLKMQQQLLVLFLLMSFSSSFAQSVTLKDFEKIDSVKSPKEYFIKKDFVVKNDSSSGEHFKLKMLNRSTREILNVAVNKDSLGPRSVDIEYFTPSQEEYSKIVHTLTKMGYVIGKGDNRHYEKRIGSYETYELVLRELVAVKDKDYYAINYSYHADKELFMPPAPAPVIKKAPQKFYY